MSDMFLPHPKLANLERFACLTISFWLNVKWHIEVVGNDYIDWSQNGF